MPLLHFDILHCRDNLFVYLGPWTSAGVEVLGTFYSALHTNKSTIPDLQLMVLPLGAAKDYGFILKRAMGISDEVYKIKKIQIIKNRK